MNQTLVTIVLATLAVGLPVLIVLAVRFLWDRNLNLGHSKEFEKLIWQLHRIASALEHELNLSYPAVQPGTEEARDIAYLQPLSAPATAIPSASSGASTYPTHKAEIERPATPVRATQETASQEPSAAKQPPVPLPVLQETETPRRAGVNSMFGL